MNTFIKSIANINQKVYRIMKIGIYFSFIFCILASLILHIYNFYSEPQIFHIGISLFQSGLFFLVTFIICGFAFNKIYSEV